jgi:penicillin-binding protein 1B
MKKLDAETHGTGLETAAIFTHRATGEIAALRGSRDPDATGFNRALDAVRQIGSLYKPVVYLTALENPGQFTLATPLQDTAVRIKIQGGPAWKPQNYDDREHGTVLLYQALAHSYNLATVRLGMNLGIAHTVKTLHNLGVDRKLEMVPSLLLGTAALTPFEVTKMYQTLAADGFVMPLRSIHAVVSPEGKTLRRYGLNPKQTLDPTAVFLTNTALQAVMREGTGRPALSTLPASFAAAGKTGTTNDLRDSWFAGFTGDYLGVVWVGRDDNQPARLTGARGALRIWAAAMRKASNEPLRMDAPDQLEWAWIDRSTGARSVESCPNAEKLPFAPRSAPSGAVTCGSGGAVEEDEKSWLKELF